MENNILQVKIWGKDVGLMYWDYTRNAAIFEYNKVFLQSGIDIAPISMSVNSPRSRNSLPWIGNKDKLYQGLPPVFADSLPDKWGSVLFNKWIEKCHVKRNITPVDQLSYIGARGMGALEFYPAHELGKEEASDVSLVELYDFARSILSERQDAVFSLQGDILWQDIIKIGTSAGGKHPKAIVAYNEDTKEVRSGQTNAPEGFRQYILKFDEPAEFPYTRIEFIYYQLAREAGVNMNPCRLMEVSEKFHFMTERFDRNGNEKIHMQTVAAMEPDADSYEAIFKIMRQLRLPASEFTELFRRMVFNVLAGNVDDHNKNFAFLMTADGTWKLSPAYDITLTLELSGLGYMNGHEMSLNGKKRDIIYGDLEKIGKENNINNFRDIIEQVKKAISLFPEKAKKIGINPEISKLIENSLRKQDVSIPLSNNRFSELEL